MQTLKQRHGQSEGGLLSALCCLVLLFLPSQPLKASSAEGVTCRQRCVAGREQVVTCPAFPSRSSFLLWSHGLTAMRPKNLGRPKHTLRTGRRACLAVSAASLPPEAAVDERHRRLTLVRPQGLVKHNRPDQSPQQLNSCFPPALLAFR